MSWTNDYKNIPFKDRGRDENGVDCWGLVALILKNECGIEVPSYIDDYDNTEERDKLAGLIAEERAKLWESVDKPQPFDVIVLEMRGVPMHVGIVIGDRLMIHCSKGVGVSVEDYTGMKWRYNVLGFERWRKN